LTSRICTGLREVAPPEIKHPLWQDDEMRRFLDNLAPQMLAYVTHEIAIPYLAQAALNGHFSALAGLRRIGTPAAMALLRDFAASRNANLAIAAFQQLRLAQDEPIQLAPASSPAD